MEELLTDHEKKLAQRREEVVTRYKRLREKYQDASNNRIFGCIAEDLGMTIPGVRTICIEMGATQPVKDQCV